VVNYENILRRSWALTIKNKWLWVYGLVIAALSGGGSGFNGFGSGSSSEKKLPNLDTSFLNGWLAQVPVTTWVLLGLGLVFLILVGAVVAWVARVWAKGALIGGLKDADDEKEITLANTAPHGFKNIKNLMIYGLISGGISMGIFIILSIPLVLTALSSNWVLFALLVFLGVMVLVIIFVLLAMVNIYAERLIVLGKISPWIAWKKGLALSRGNFLPTMLMGLINTALGCAIGCLTVILLAVFVIPAIIFALLLPVGAIGLILLIILFLSASLAIRMVLTVFTYSNWNLFFKEVANGR
jgi:hypothetical protein